VVTEHSENPKKKPAFTQDIKSPQKEITNTKGHKQGFLSSDLFGSNE